MARNSRLVICRNCNSPISEDVKRCPSCGAKNKKSSRGRGWLILLAVVVVLGVKGYIGSRGEKIAWSEMELSKLLPEPASNRGTLHENSDERLYVSINDYSDAEYSSYRRSCADIGYTIDAKKDTNTYKAYNSEGYCLELSHIGDRLSIELKAPMILGTITWPTSSAGDQLPAPKSTIGKFSFERDGSFFVYVGDMSRADYDEYVAACSGKGFNINYNKGDTFYYADNAEGWHISLQYEGYSIISIRIDAPDKEETSGFTKPEEASESEETTRPEELTKSQEEINPKETAKPEETAELNETAKLEENAEAEESTATEEMASLEEPNEDQNETGLDPEFKAAMDSYEEFMDKYVAFMKKYNENSSDLGLLVDYAKFMNDYLHFVDSFEKWEDADLNTEETKYYIEVQSRVAQKLLDITG